MGSGSKYGERVKEGTERNGRRGGGACKRVAERMVSRFDSISRLDFFPWLSQSSGEASKKRGRDRVATRPVKKII